MGSESALKCDLLMILIMRFCRKKTYRKKRAEIGFIGRSLNYFAAIKLRIN